MSHIKVNICHLADAHERTGFKCGLEFIDRYIKKRCVEDHNLHKARVYVATEPESKVVVGFFTLSLTSLRPDDNTPEEAQKKFGKWVIPLVYLGQIGVHKPYQGVSGIGSAMMLHAFEQTAAIANIAGTYGLMLDAVDEEKAKWYERLDFFRFDTEKDGRIKMICPLNRVSAALALAR